MAKNKTGGTRTQSDPFAGLLAQAIAAHERGQIDDAEKLYVQILNKNPRHADALHLFGVTRLQRGMYEQGNALILNALHISPNPTMRSNLANGLIKLERYEEALLQTDLAIAQDPKNPSILTNRGAALGGLKRHEEAVRTYQQAIRLRPNFIEAINNLGNAQRSLGQYAEALKTYERALQINPRYPESLNNQGLAYLALGQLDEAGACFDKALALRPNYPEAWSNQGNLAKRRGNYAQAYAHFEKALELRPNFIDALYNRANTWGSELRLDEALRGYDEVKALRPRHPDANWNSVLIHLLRGNFAAGWAGYHWRWQMPSSLKPRQYPCPCWTGHEDLQGRSILLWAEQGLGDTIHFCRMAAELVARGATVLLDVQPVLNSLLRRSLPAGVEVLPPGIPIPPTDFHCPLLSVPGALGITLETIPAHIPYLVPDAAKIGPWRARLGEGRPRIGLVCSGNPKLGNDANRSIPFSSFAPWLEADAHFYCVQKDLREADAAWLAQEPRITNLGAGFEDFDDTAAVLAQLDLVISVDTSVAHLAGALGRPVWLLLPFMPDWRWLLERTDSPWYPTLRLYRQQAVGDWAGVLDRVAADLSTLA